MSWFSRLKLRIKKAYHILVYGYFTYEFDIIINDEEHIRSFIEALQYGLDKLEQNQGGLSKNGFVG